MHWWKFCALLEPLMSGADFSDRVKFWMTDTRGRSREQAAYYWRMKQVFAIRSSSGIEQKLTLVQRDAGLKEYVRQRLGEAGKRPPET